MFLFKDILWQWDYMPTSHPDVYIIILLDIVNSHMVSQNLSILTVNTLGL